MDPTRRGVRNTDDRRGFAVRPIVRATYPSWEVVAIAHRGLSGFPENTLAAFRSVMARGIKVIELDLRGTADGEVVVLHDETVDRTTNGARSYESALAVRPARVLSM